MILKRICLGGLLAGLGFATAACTDGYGYSGVNVGYADPYYGYGGYYDGYGGYPGYGAYGVSGFGWYGDYYYPGTGIYVYDRFRRPYRWNDNQRRYWQGRRGGDRGNIRGNWGGFAANRGADGRPGFAGPRPDGQRFRGNRSQPSAGRAFQNGRAPDAGGQGFRGRTGGDRGFGGRSGGRRSR